MSPPLFEPITLRDLTLANRIVVSPMAQYSAGSDGLARDWHLMHYGTLAVSGAGLVILEATAVLPEGRVSPNCLGIWDEAQVAGLRRIVSFFRDEAAGHVGIQLAHAGRKASTAPPAEGGAMLPSDGGRGWRPWGASDCAYPGRETPVHPTEPELEAVVEGYLAALDRAGRAGFDLVELHLAHGYFLNNFLSPLSNTRTDRFGGDIEGRMRFPLEVFARLRAAWPAGKPMGVRLSGTDWVAGGWSVDDSVRLARRLKALGCDYVALSSGGSAPEQQIPVGPAYQVPLSEEVRHGAHMATMAVGMLSDPELANAVIAEGRADMVAIGRGMLFNPRWAWHAAERLGGPMRVPRPYLRCHPSMRNLPR